MPTRTRHPTVNRRLSPFAALAAATTAVLLWPVSALGSCGVAPGVAEGIAGADVVFVGTVQGLGDSDRTATFSVEEQWRGDPLPAIVQVHGGPGDLNSATSVDRSYEAGVRYLVAAYIVEGRLTDNACSVTQPWSDELAAFRPAKVLVPTPDAENRTRDIPLPVLGGVIALAIVVVVGVLAFRPTNSR